MLTGERISEILQRWFISEPPMFGVLCLHETKENRGMTCPLRCGQKRLEYNPELTGRMSDTELEECLRAEAVRILMGHPYRRRPDGCSQAASALGSNVTIGDNYDHRYFEIEKPGDFNLKGRLPYEVYSREIEALLPPGPGEQRSKKDSRILDTIGPDGAGLEKYTDLSELWDEDDFTWSEISCVINSTKDWGSIPGEFAEKLIASTKSRINWRTALAGFRSSILCSRRKLTRMKPSRRSGFDQMGSVREFSTKVLVAVDVSGSISSESLSYFYGVVNSAFRYGVEALDVVEFDCGITKVCSLRKKLKTVEALGRGGTSFDEPIRYAHENGYDGLVILTDGYAPEPVIPQGFRCGILWVCENRDSFEAHEHWMKRSGRVCVMELQ